MQSVRKRPPSHRRTERSGAAALEMALILPVMITIVLGCVDFGRFAYMNISVNNAARAGVAVGAMNPYPASASAAVIANWKTKVKDAAREEISSQSGFEAARLTLTDPVLITETGGLKRVQLRVAYRFNTIVSWPLLPNEMTMTRTMEMRQLR